MPSSLQRGPDTVRKHSAFTLIELLVVIAIIAILAAILFPVFAQAKDAAKKIRSISNLKQMSTAVVLYLGDSDGVFPQNMYMADGDGLVYGTGTIAAGVYDVVLPYIKSREIFTSPGDVRAIEWSATPQTLTTVLGAASGGTWTSLANIKTVSYWFNSALFEDPAIPPTLGGNDPVSSEGSVQDPVATTMFYDAKYIRAGDNNLDAPTTTPYYAPPGFLHTNFPGTYRYNESICVTFTDTHAKAYRKNGRIEGIAPDSMNPGNFVDVYRLPYDLNGLPEVKDEPVY